MVKRCVAANCGNSNKTKHSMHEFPSDQKIRRLWIKFIQTRRADFSPPPKKSQAAICEMHFTSESYTAQSKYMTEFGLSYKKALLYGAVPTIHVECSDKDKTKGKVGLKRAHNDDDPTTSTVCAVTTDTCTVHEDNSRPKQPSSQIKKSRAASKLEVARLLQAKQETTDISCNKAASSKSVETQATPLMINVAIQFTEKKSTMTKGVGTECKMVDHGTQYDPPDSPDPCMSTPSKSHIPTSMKPQLSISPIKTVSFDLSPNPSPAAHIDDSDAAYEPSNISIQEAIEEEQIDQNVQEDISIAQKLDEKSPAAWVDDKKFIVFERQLLELFKNCPLCTAASDGKIIDSKPGSGTLVKVMQTCSSCTFTRIWNSQPYSHQMPVGNLMLSGAILFSGSLPSQVIKLFDIMNIACYSRSTFNRHQTNYVIPTIINVWDSQQQDFIFDLHNLGNGLELAGDARNDSPGHSAKYGSYTILEQTTKKILDVQTVQSNEVSSSNACELEGFKRSMSFLTETHGFNIDTMVTDRHQGITKYIREILKKQYPDLKHYNDAWHTGKGLGKKIDKIAQKKGCREVGLWKRSIVNHMYYVAAIVPEGDEREDIMEAMWRSVDNHVHDIHEHDSPLFPFCDHVHLPYDREKEWLKLGSNCSTLLSELLNSSRMINDVRRLTPKYQTSSLEAYHSLVIRFAPKHTHFSWLGQIARTYIAALHHNENADRLQAVTKAGIPQYQIIYPKFKKGGHTAKPVKTTATHEYTKTLMTELLSCYHESPTALASSIDELRARQPHSLASDKIQPNRQEAIDQHRTRFATNS